MKIRIDSYIDISVVDEAVAVVNALSMVDTSKLNSSDDRVIKLYYIAPKIDKLLVVVSASDMSVLNVDSCVLEDTKVSDYSIDKLPSKVLEYRELNIVRGSSLSDTNILNIAQYMADARALELLPHKIPIIKIINYNNDLPSILVIPSMFRGVFNSSDAIVNNGDSIVGGKINKAKKLLAQGAYEDRESIESGFAYIDNLLCSFDGTYWRKQNGHIVRYEDIQPTIPTSQKEILTNKYLLTTRSSTPMKDLGISNGCLVKYSSWGKFGVDSSLTSAGRDAGYVANSVPMKIIANSGSTSGSTQYYRFKKVAITGYELLDRDTCVAQLPF